LPYYSGISDWDNKNTRAHCLFGEVPYTYSFIRLGYDISKYNLKEGLQKYLCVNEFETLHLADDFEYAEVFERKNDQSTKHHKKYYELSNSFFLLYDRFVRNEILPLYSGEKIVYQKIPNLRIHFPSNIAVGEWHRDRDYRDLNWANEVREINYFVPLTDAYGTNTIWYETQEGLKDYTPMNCKYGEFVEWDGSNLTHGNKINETEITRVSIDFRVIPYSRFRDSVHSSINTNVKFSVGGYYNLAE